MLFFPYRVDLDLNRYPLVTILVCILCVYVFMQQLKSHDDYVQSIENFCDRSVDRTTLMVLRQVAASDSGYPCVTLYLDIRESEDSRKRIKEMVLDAPSSNVFRSREAELAYLESVLTTAYARFDASVPVNLTDELMYDPSELNVERMVTSTFSHGSWAHLIFNLIFFFAFAASVELITGSLIYIAIILSMAVTTGLAYSYSVAGNPDLALPTVGLSGVVMGMMLLLTVLLPSVRIRCFFWFLFFVRRFSIPALILAAWYLGGDIYNMMHDDGSSRINFVAHVSGAATGIFVGLLYWIFRPNFIRKLMR